MSDPKVEERARKLLDPYEFRVRPRGGAGSDSSAVGYWDAVHVVADLLTKLDEAEEERDAAYLLGMARGSRELEAVKERERVLVARVRELAELADPDPTIDRDIIERLEVHGRVRAILSRLLPSTPTEKGKTDD